MTASGQLRTIAISRRSAVCDRSSPLSFSVVDDSFRLESSMCDCDGAGDRGSPRRARRRRRRRCRRQRARSDERSFVNSLSRHSVNTDYPPRLHVDHRRDHDCAACDDDEEYPLFAGTRASTRSVASSLARGPRSPSPTAMTDVPVARYASTCEPSSRRINVRANRPISRRRPRLPRCRKSS